jgi:hypothetical protein
VLDPHSGGMKIPEPLQEKIRRRIVTHAEKRYAGRYAPLDLRFKGALCYIDAYREPETRGEIWKITGETRQQFIERMRATPLHLCRLRHFAAERWSVAFYTYSRERYGPCFLRSGEAFGTVEEGFDVGAVYLSDG